MPLSRADALILGGVSTSRSRGAPSSNLFRQNTARLLTMLDVTLLPKPPSFLLASKIVSDLQLPGTYSIIHLLLLHDSFIFIQMIW